MDWRGRPLSCHEVIVQTIAATTTATGLRVHAELDTSAYDTGVKISDAQMGALPLTRHDWHGDWNYTLLPRTTTRPAALPIRSTSPGLAWPGCAPGADRPAAQQWDAGIARLLALHDQQRETSLGERRIHACQIVTVHVAADTITIELGSDDIRTVPPDHHPASPQYQSPTAPQGCPCFLGHR